MIHTHTPNIFAKTQTRHLVLGKCHDVKVFSFFFAKCHTDDDDDDDDYNVFQSV